MQWDFCLSYWFWFFLWKINPTSLHMRGRLKELSRISCTYGNHENVPCRLGTKGTVMEDGLLFAVLNRNSLPHWAESTLLLGCSRLVTEHDRDTKARVFLGGVVHIQWMTSGQEVLDGLSKPFLVHQLSRIFIPFLPSLLQSVLDLHYVVNS